MAPENQEHDDIDDDDEVFVVRGRTARRLLGLDDPAGGSGGDDDTAAPPGFEFDEDGYLRKIAKAVASPKKPAGATKKRGFFDPR